MTLTSSAAWKSLQSLGHEIALVHTVGYCISVETNKLPLPLQNQQQSALLVSHSIPPWKALPICQYHQCDRIIEAVHSVLEKTITCTVEEECLRPHMLGQPPALESRQGESGHWALFSTLDHETAHLLHKLVRREEKIRASVIALPQKHCLIFLRVLCKFYATFFM